MYSTKNPNVLTPAMQGVILDLTIQRDANLTANFNGKSYTHSIETLLKGSKAHFLIGWLSESILFSRAIPEDSFTFEHYMKDTTPEKDTDYYYIRVRQRNQQWAWSSPIWVEKV